MRYNPHVHRRRSIRLPNYDYGESGAYFITICTHNRELLFGDRLVREIVFNAWHELPRRFPSARLDEFVVMPNHVHGILWIVKGDPPVGAQHRAWPDAIPPENDTPNSAARSFSNHAAPLRPAVEPVPFSPPRRVVPGSLGAIVRAFKSRAAKRINRLRRTPNAPVWQRNYYEHIIRNEEGLARIRQYIIDNPAKWAEDVDNPANWPRTPTAVGAQHDAQPRCHSTKQPPGSRKRPPVGAQHDA